MLMVAMTGFLGLESAAESVSLPTAKEVISAHKVCFDKPARHIPATTSVDAPLLGNGYMAVALGGSPDKQVQVTGSKSGTKIYNGEYIIFPTGENETFVITEAD